MDVILIYLMNENVKIDILRVLDSTINMIEKENVSGMKEISDHTIHNSSIFQDDDSIGVAVVIYTLAKIFEREKHIDKNMIPIILKAKRKLMNEEFDGYRKQIKIFYEKIIKKDTQHKLYIQEVMSQAGVRKSSKIYDHGISLGQSAKILGVSQWELMDYLGQTKIADNFKEPMNLRRRLSIARKIFGVNK